MFIGSTLQIDLAGNSSTATLGRIAGFGGAPNMGSDARGRRHASPAWLPRGARARGRMRAASARPEARRADGRDVPRAHAARVRRDARRVGAHGGHGDGAAADHDLRRRRHAHRHRGGHRQPAPVPRRPPSASRPSAASPASRRSACERDRRIVENLRDRGVIRRAEDLGDRYRATRRATCSRRAASRTLCAGRAASTSRRRASATGRRPRWKRSSSRSRSQPSDRHARAPALRRRGRLGQSRGADRARAGGRRLPTSRAHVRARLRRIWHAVRETSTAPSRRPPCASSINDMGATPAVVSCAWTRPSRS